MNYTFIAIGCYIFMRAFRVLFEDRMQKPWCKLIMKVLSLIVLFAALASVIVFYKKLNLLGFDPYKSY